MNNKKQKLKTPEEMFIEEVEEEIKKIKNSKEHKYFGFVVFKDGESCHMFNFPVLLLIQLLDHVKQSIIEKYITNK